MEHSKSLLTGLDEPCLPSPPCSASGTPDPCHRAEFLGKYSLTQDMLCEISRDLVVLARKAGEMITEADPSVENSKAKNNSSDRVTATDRAVEKMVHDHLGSFYPKYGFLGEETFKTGDLLSDEPTFICDPIDGTLNFIHGFPNVAVSLALSIEKKPFVGVVFNPFRRELFTAIKWQGAFLTVASDAPRRLPIAPVPRSMGSLGDCLVAMEWGNQRSGPNWELRTRMHKQLLTGKAEKGVMVHSVRSSGSAALDLCYVAAGWMDVFWEGGAWAWDVAAGWCVLEEAGGMIVSANPADWEPSVEGRVYLGVRAGKRSEQEEVVRQVWEQMGEGRFVY